MLFLEVNPIRPPGRPSMVRTLGAFRALVSTRAVDAAAGDGGGAATLVGGFAPDVEGTTVDAAAVDWLGGVGGGGTYRDDNRNDNEVARTDAFSAASFAWCSAMIDFESAARPESAVGAATEFGAWSPVPKPAEVIEPLPVGRYRGLLDRGRGAGANAKGFVAAMELAAAAFAAAEVGAVGCGCGGSGCGCRFGMRLRAGAGRGGVAPPTVAAPVNGCAPNSD